MPDLPGETRDELLALAHERGYQEVSPAQLVRWHKAGLLPRPRQRPLGKSHGTQTVYPPGTGERLLALCAVHQHERRLPDVAWRLWWAGYDIPMASVQALVTEAVDKWERFLRETVGDVGSGDLPEQAWDIIDQIDTARLAHPLERRMRKRVGRKRFPTVIRVALEILAGTFTGDAEDEALLEKALGLDRARKDRVAGADPWLTGDSSDALAALSQLLQEHPFRALAEAATDEDLRQARDDLRTLVQALESVLPVLERMFGQGAFGLGMFVLALRDLPPILQAWFLLVWRMFRLAGYSPTMDMYLGWVRRWLDVGLPWVQAMERLRADVPAFDGPLALEQVGAALRNPRKMQALLIELATVAQEHQPKVATFLDAHPEARLSTPKPT